MINMGKLENVPGFRTVVGALLIKDNAVLFVRRSKNNFMGGIYELPSGKVEKNENNVSALIREVKEEVGLEVTGDLKPVHEFIYTSQSGKNTKQITYQCTFNKSSDVTLSEEHDHYVWVPLSDIDNVDFLDEKMKEIAKSVVV